MSEELPVPVEKIKKEKVTPPSSPVRDPAEKLEEITKLFRENENSKADEDEPRQGNGHDQDEPEEKKETGPIKTSDEFLMELFQVFNAAPPNVGSGKKKKHKKHKKKSKKRKRDSKSDLSDVSDSDEEVGVDNKESKRKRKVKVKKESNAEDEERRLQRKIKKERRSRSRERSPRKSDKEIKLEKDTTRDKIKEEVDSDKKDNKRSSKIVIKDLKSSLVIAEAESKERERKRRISSRRSSSSLSLSDEETYEKEKQSRQRQRSRDRGDRDYSSRRDDDHFRSSYRESRRSSRRSEPRHGEDMRERIDKKRLLEIARKNAMTMLKNGALPGITTMKELQQARYSGRSIDELTDFCKKISNGEVLSDLSSVSSGDSDHDREGNSKAFHHPFVLKDRGPIVLNIRNSIPIPTRSVDQTNAILQAFPVSSGQQHRQSEMEWVPVEPTKPKAIEAAKPTTVAKKPGIGDVPPPPTSAPATPTTIVARPPPLEHSGPQLSHPPAFVTYPPLRPYANSAPVEPLQPPPQPPLLLTESVFQRPPPEAASLDVSSIISQRLNAMRKLQENPNDNAAITQMENSQKEMSSWAASKFTPGKFLGSTGANILSAKELQSGGTQAWAKKDAFTNCAPLSGGKGMHLLQKMGWKPGEALGKEKTGSLEPLLLEVKLDRKGLVSNEEVPNRPKKRPPFGGAPRNMQMSQQFMESKHPVSLLGELASKRKWGAPMYELVHESGPHHHKSFVYQVIMNGMAYTPAIPCTTKKEAKKIAAQVCLEQLGVLATQGPQG